MGFETTRSNKPRLANKGSRDEDRRISVCTDCKHGIFKTQEYVWTRRAGLVHTECDERYLSEIEIRAKTALPKKA